MTPDHAEPIVLAQSLMRDAYYALESRRYDEALALTGRAREQVDKVITVAWAQKPGAMG